MLRDFSERLEGRSRPGHFRGVSTVVMKLLQIVQPQFAYFGRKDAQQAAIISRMASDLNLDAEIVVCPIVREADGLAMSSRNAYLSRDQRKAAAVLHRALQAAQTVAGQRQPGRAIVAACDAPGSWKASRRQKSNTWKLWMPKLFQPVANVNRPSYALLAAKIGDTRLLDNLFIRVQYGDGDELEQPVSRNYSPPDYNGHSFREFGSTRPWREICKATPNSSDIFSEVSTARLRAVGDNAAVAQ